MSNYWAYILSLFVFGGIAAFVVSAVRYSNRLKFIEEYEWPPGLLKRLSSHYPNLTVAEKTKVGDGLKQFFRAYLKSGRRYVAMPSVVADDLWHEHILYTKEYHRFCDKAFGRYLHHTPAVVLRKQQRADNEGLRRVWTHACREEGIDYKSPKRLPLIFALDTLLNIPGGYRYAPDCRELRDGSSAGTQCGGDMGSSSYDGGTSGLGDGDGGSGSWGDGGGDGGGCGGGGD